MQTTLEVITSIYIHVHHCTIHQQLQRYILFCCLVLVLPKGLERIQRFSGNACKNHLCKYSSCAFVRLAADRIEELGNKGTTWHSSRMLRAE